MKIIMNYYNKDSFYWYAVKKECDPLYIGEMVPMSDKFCVQMERFGNLYNAIQIHLKKKFKKYRKKRLG